MLWRVKKGPDNSIYGPVDIETLKEWANSASLMARMNFALQLAGNKVPGVKVEVAQAAKPGDPLAGIPLGSPDFQKR